MLFEKAKTSMASPFSNAESNEHIKFASLFRPEQIICNTVITDRDQIIHELLKLLAYQCGVGNVEETYKAVLAREEAVSTVIAPGIAVPHARLQGIEQLIIGVATSRSGINFGPKEAEQVKLVMLILAPKAKPALYLQAVSSVSKICGEPGTADAVSSLQTAKDVWRFFDREGMILPDYVCAADVMNREFVCLREHDTLEQAVDTLVKYNLVDLPVVDEEGDLVGVVTAYELLRVCLPDYILWMEDLSPVLNFEPFAEVLKKEGKTWLTDVMSLDYPTVAEDVPAIQVAKEITRRGARQVFVVCGRKLVGIITLQGFINKVLRE
jgi:PTS system nitrogen regulatory IIA component